jgi:V/A-type H+/Na+-transporting ATPase subunit I
MLLLPATAVIGKYLAITGAIGMVLFAGRSKKNIIMRLLSGVLSLYGVTGFLGDVLSYLRLFALGLATGVIGAVVNSMALMVGGSVIGYIFMTLFLILGHTFNLGINTLGAYVHSSRLQYVEFFGKFYEGEGKPFIPFRMRTKYIEQK